MDYKTQEVWLWVATEATSKLIPVIQVGPRSLDMAMGAVHALGCTMQTGSLPIITTDGLNLTLRLGVALLGRRTWGTAQYMPELEGHLQWWRDYYHYSRYHESLRITQGPPSSARANSFPTLSQPNPSPGGWPDQPPLVSAATD